MTGRERLTKTFRGERPHRMPIAPFLWLNNGYKMFGYRPDINTSLSPADFDVAEKFVAYRDFSGFDVLFSPGLVYDCYVPPSAESWDVTIVRDGDQDQQPTTAVGTPAGQGQAARQLDFEHERFPLRRPAYENLHALADAGREFGGY